MRRPDEDRLNRIERAIENNAAQIADTNRLIRELATFIQEHESMLQWLIRTVQTHEQRLDRVEGRRPT